MQIAEAKIQMFQTKPFFDKTPLKLKNLLFGVFEDNHKNRKQNFRSNLNQMSTKIS